MQCNKKIKLIFVSKPHFFIWVLFILVFVNTVKYPRVNFVGMNINDGGTTVVKIRKDEEQNVVNYLN
jgi:hypothetical protein